MNANGTNTHGNAVQVGGISPLVVPVESLLCLFDCSFDGRVQNSVQEHAGCKCFINVVDSWDNHHETW